MENNQTAMYDFLVHIRKMKNQLMREYQNQRADYYMVRIFDGLELKAHGFLTQEKEQIIDAYKICDNGNASDEDGEQYYNETYGNKITQTKSI
jgi:hypothetical protein